MEDVERLTIQVHEERSGRDSPSGPMPDVMLIRPQHKMALRAAERARQPLSTPGKRRRMLLTCEIGIRWYTLDARAASHASCVVTEGLQAI